MKLEMKVLILVTILTFSLIQPAFSEEDLPFRFDSIANNKQSLAEKYVTWNHDLHQNKLFQFTLALQRGWNALKTKEPTGISNTPTEIAAFHRFAETANTKSSILAGMYFYVVQVPDNQTARHYLRNQISQTYPKMNLQIVKEDITDTHADYLFTYVMDEKKQVCRVFGFAMPNNTIYFVQLQTNETNYRAFAAEAFWIARKSFRLRSRTVQ